MKLLDKVYDFQGYYGSAAWCYIKIYRSDNGWTTVIATEPIDSTGGYANRGISITNAAEKLATEIIKKFPIIDPGKLSWIEHYPARGGWLNKMPEHFSLVQFKFNGREFSSPTWVKKEKIEIEDLIGEKL
ncbi:MAG: hypothetical protein J0I20_33880 [Chloroflexi bacterium]|nr:hypothetical protein [Chloroflexota bacterium]